jgi:hypothetical protein
MIGLIYEKMGGSCEPPFPDHTVPCQALPSLAAPRRAEPRATT